MCACGVPSGDFSGSPPAALERSGTTDIAPGLVTWLQQVHGNEVVVVRHPGDMAGSIADAAVTTVRGAVLAVRTADCAPVALGSPQGVIGLAHAGWRGLLAGVLEATVAVMRQNGARQVEAAIGPCIAAHGYAFSRSDLGLLKDRYGDEVEGTTSDGYPALDLPRAVRAALGACGVTGVRGPGTCTHCSPEHWSWRARRDVGRQGTLFWLEQEETD